MEYQASGNGTIMRAGGPDRAERTVLCLPGGLCTAAFFDDLFAEPAIEHGDVRLLATTLPGFGGVPLPTGFDASVESHAERAANLAREAGCDTVLGHSFGANVAIEMAAAGHFDGRLILLSPSFSREDESRALAILNGIGYVPGIRAVVDAIVFRSLSKMLDGNVPAERVDALASEMARSDRKDVRLTTRRYFEYLDRHGTLVGRLCRSGISAEVVFGDADDVGLTAGERGALESCPTTRLHVVPDCGHMIMNQRPDWVAELISTVALEGATHAAAAPRSRSLSHADPRQR
jgi:pimeloyl-ACP methyl ester carboxylesterase